MNRIKDMNRVMVRLNNLNWSQKKAGREFSFPSMGGGDNHL